MSSFTLESPTIDLGKVAQLHDELLRWFDGPFSFYDGYTGEAVEGACLQEGVSQDVILAVAKNGSPCFLSDLADYRPATLDNDREYFAIPVLGDLHRIVAVGEFRESNAAQSDEQSQQSKSNTSDKVWDRDTLKKLGVLVFEKLTAEARVKQLTHEADTVSHNLSTTYEEISLIYGLIQNLHISQTDEELARLAVDWLMECVPASGVAIQLLPVADSREVTYKIKARTKPNLIACGDCHLSDEDLAKVLEHANLTPGSRPYIANLRVTDQPEWQIPKIRQVIVAPMCEGDNLFGWVIACNHTADDEFGTVEANLISSVAGILGTHAGNRELYRQQAEFLASVVRALTSAIDAKDPYTCGHSDRVARVSVQLGKQLGCNSEDLSTLYMAGLLHDIGKIGIDDNVLCKPGKLTDAEYDHIKMHPELGHNILADIRQLADCMPIVLHHHEQYDGEGYPYGLEGEDIPWLARIAAVADAYDAMTSDRPYRKGMPFEKVESILASGAGGQWDATVVDAFLAARDAIKNISSSERENLSLDVQQWM